MNKHFDCLVVGELNIDLVLWDVPMPVYEQEQLAGDMRFAMGSSSAITAHNFAALGGEVCFLGKAGSDYFGDFMVAQLKAGGVDTTGIIRDARLKTGATIVLANPPQKALLTYLGAMTDLTLEDINWDLVASARHLHLGCFFLQTGIRGSVAQLFKKAKELGLSTSLDTNWDPDDEWGEDLQRALEYTDIFFPNDDEALRISGRETLEEAIETLRSRVRVLAVKCGADGAVLHVGDEHWRDFGFQRELVETTGAG
ncbi:MAG TPA: carbohydrate kinase family protein, partial [Calditrichia bacterium]|nr:carbohydrate kinase family protein [Calditrichia bacterium]